MVINFNKKIFNTKYILKIQTAYDYLLDYLKIEEHDLEVNITFVSKSKIKELNNEFRHNDKVTDVLSFPNLLTPDKTDMQLIVDKIAKDNYPYDVNPDTNCIFLGDICICKPVVYAHAKEYGNSRLREMVYMAVHGLLHLLGYDHIKDEDKKIMREVEEAILTHVDLSREGNE